MSSQPLPQPVSGLGSGVSQISAGTHTCAIVKGAARCWGRNLAGQLGVGQGIAGSAVPVQVVGLTGGVTRISVTKAADNAHTCAVVGGGARCWGYNYAGQLGLGYWDASIVYTPAQVVGLTSGVSDITAGGDHSCAVVNGSALCWGFSYYGQVGNGSIGTYDKFTTPQNVSGLGSGVSAIAAGTNFSCALVNGAVKCWGANESGQLGNSSTSNSAYPEQVSGLSGEVTALDLGGASACALKNQEVWCWGSGYGLTPVRVNGLSDVTGIANFGSTAGSTCAIQTNGLFCWGDNSYGELGDGRSFERAQAEAVVGFGPQPEIRLNKTRAQAGSVLHLVGAHLPANGSGWLEANGERLGDLHTDSAGQFSAVLLTGAAADGYYQIRVVVGVAHAQTELYIDADALQLAQQGGGAIYALVPGGGHATPWPSATPYPTATPVPGATPTNTPVARQPFDYLNHSLPGRPPAGRHHPHLRQQFPAWCCGKAG
jgi:hypothetical protein